MYSGRAARSNFNTAGGVINYQCFPDDPEYDEYGTGGRRAKIYGVEYEDPISALGDLDDFNVPCAVCYVPTHATSLMIPAKLTCPTGWTEEYDGYLMGAYHGFTSPSTVECVDRNPESVPDSGDNKTGGVFFQVEVECNYGLKCPPYYSEKEVTCVVCTR